MRRLALVLACALAAAAPGVAAAQQPDTAGARADTTRAGLADSTTRTHGDSVRPVPPVTPTGAFFRSLLIPGWGQARLGRNVTAGLFIAFEGFAGAMVWKTYWQLDYARTRERYVKSHTQEREDWLVLLAFNHLFAGAEAYVSAHLYDFPAALKIQVLPDGRTGVGLQLPLPHP